MPKFTDFIAQNLTRGGYTVIEKSDQDVFAWSPLDGKPIWVCYVDAPLKPEQIRRSFDFKGHILYVVDDKLIPQEIIDRDSTPMWLRVIHGLYFGRVYTWNGRFLYGLHFDYDNGDINESGIISPDRLLLIEEGTWLRGWTGNYRTARFYEKTWWTVQDNFSSSRQSYQQAKQGRTDNDPNSWWYGQYDPNTDKYRQARERDQQWQKENARQGKQWYSQTPGGSFEQAQAAPPKQRDFKAEFKACKNEAEAKTLYRAFVREFHPDFNQEGRSAEEIVRLTEIMKQINVSWEYMQGWWA